MKKTKTAQKQDPVVDDAPMTIGDCNIKEYYLQDEIDNFRQVFRQYDVQDRGYITKATVTEVYKEMGLYLKPWQVDQSFAEYDTDGNGTIDFEEFMAMMITINAKTIRPDIIDYRDFLADAVIKELDVAFREADDGNGLLDKKEVAKIFRKRGMNFVDTQMEMIFRQVDTDNSGQVTFQEFCNLAVSLTGTRKRLNAHEYIDDDDYMALRKAFNQFDDDGGGSINVEELAGIFAMMGMAVPPEKQHLLIEKYDADGSGQMEFDEFVAMMVDLKKMRKKRNINPTTIQAKQLRVLGFSAKEVKNLGYSPALMRQDGYISNEMVAAKFPTETLRHAGYTSAELRAAGLGPSVMKRSGFSATDLRNKGYSHAALRAGARCMNQHPKDVPFYVERRAHSAPRLPSHTTPRIRHFVDHEHHVNVKKRGKEMKQKFRAAGNVLKKAMIAIKASDNMAGEHTNETRDQQQQRFQLLRGAQQIMRNEREVLAEDQRKIEEKKKEKEKQEAEEKRLEQQRIAAEKKREAILAQRGADGQRPGKKRVSHADVDIALNLPQERPVTR